MHAIVLVFCREFTMEPGLENKCLTFYKETVTDQESQRTMIKKPWEEYECDILIFHNK